MSIIRPEQLEQPFNITGSLHGTASWAQYAVNAGGGVTEIIAGDNITISPDPGIGIVTINAVSTPSPPTNIPGYILTNATEARNAITFTRYNGETFNVTVSGGGGDSFPYTGSAIITGSLIVTGSFNVTGKINDVSQLIQSITQIGNSAPIATTLVNTIGMNFTWEWLALGHYRMSTLDGTPFTPNKTIVNLTPGFSPGSFGSGNQYIVWYEIADQATIDVFVIKIGSGGYDGVLDQAGLEIRIWP